MDRSAYEKFYELDKFHFWRIGKRKLLLEIIQKYSRGQKSLHILDIGGACSILPSQLQKFGKVTVIEPDPNMVASAKEKNAMDVRAGELPSNLPVTGPFDMITLLDVLEHVEAEKEALNSIWNLLRPGGLLICTVPALQMLWSHHDVLLHHKRRYSRKQLMKVLGENQFDVLRISYYTFFLFPVLAVKRLLDRFKKHQAKEYDVKIPNPIINYLFGAVMSFERFCLRFINLPIGSSLFVICVKPGDHVSLNKNTPAYAKHTR